jgi:excisionase family DNA binding protein
LNADEDPVTVLRSLMRHVSNQEIADMLGISERTVRRWKHEGRLPRREHARLKLADLIAHLVRNGTAGTQQIGEIVRNGEARRRRRASANET